ncbi:MAG: GTP-binding protein [Nitrospirota bacterium]|nr:GTP-binding protein [Nitrospirota bacterium]MDH5585561.1 GTP-binding protein [Nitrospirota bacterium]MDH5773960.1 GTP-binding protein [Nitrospirota bacterium]
MKEQVGLQKKVCMLGGFAVGKTSLVKRFVSGIFSEKYHTTIGVKIDQKSQCVEDTEMLLVLWDVYGDDDFQKVRASYLQGSAGFLLVIDGTRKETVDVARHLHTLAVQTMGPVPYVLVINKHDLLDSWQVVPEMYEDLASSACLVLQSSAKTGEGVELAFAELAKQMLTT